MKHKELDAALALLGRVLATPGVQSPQQEQLQKARRELECIRRSGKLERRRVFRAVSMIAEALNDVVEDG